MSEIIDKLGVWLWPVIVVALAGLAIWILAIRTILRSPKFLRNGRGFS
jgi:hypothetical protein